MKQERFTMLCFAFMVVVIWLLLLVLIVVFGGGRRRGSSVGGCSDGLLFKIQENFIISKMRNVRVALRQNNLDSRLHGYKVIVVVNVVVVVVVVTVKGAIEISP